ncbi:transport protein SEC23 G-like protein [Drosera capensis]
MVRVHDIGFQESARVVLCHGNRELCSGEVQQFLGLHIAKQQMGKATVALKQGFLVPVTEFEFSITMAIEEIHSSGLFVPGHRPLRATGAAISVAAGLLEACSFNTGSRIMVFTSGPVTIGPGIVVATDHSDSIRNHRDLINGHAPFFDNSCSFYKNLACRLCGASIVLDLFACSLGQVGAAELKEPIESSGGFMEHGESFESDHFRKCLRHIFNHDEDGNLKMCFDATVEIVTSSDVKISGALGPCSSLKKKNDLVSETEIGLGGTNLWKLSTLDEKTCIAFFFQGDDGCEKVGPSNSPEIAAGFDQEAAAAAMARLAIHCAEFQYARDVIQWLDDNLIRFAAKSQFIDVFNSTPDETAYFRLMLNREGVLGSLIIIQPTLFQYSFDGPPEPVLLDICSVSPDVILLFDSYFYVVIHYGSKIAQWRKLGYHKDPNHENFRKLLEAP